MNSGSVIQDIVGRAFYVDGGSATIGGSIVNIKADTDMWQGITGIAVHGRGGSKITLTGTCEIQDFDTKADQGSVIGMYGSNLDMKKNAKIADITGISAIYMDDMGNDYIHTALINGIVDNVNNNPVMRSWYGHIEIGSTGIVQNCKASQVLYTNNGSKYTISGKVVNNSGTALYLANQSGGRVYGVMNEGAEISGTKGVAVRVNNGSQFIMNGGTIVNNSTGVQVSGKANFKGVEFVMNGGTISDNASGISYTIAGESKVVLNGGSVTDNGDNYQITAYGGSAKNINENLYIASGVLKENSSISLSAGTVTLDPNYGSVWLGTASTAARDKIKSLVIQEHPTWKVAGYSALWILPEAAEGEESVSYHFQLESSYADTSGLYMAYIPLNADGTPAENAELVLQEVKNTPAVDISLKGLTSGTPYAVMLVNNDVYTLSSSNTIYTGGVDYENTHGLPTDYFLNGIGKISSIKVGETETTYNKYSSDDQAKALADLKALLTVSCEVSNDQTSGAYPVKLEWITDQEVKINGNNVKLADGTLIIRHIADKTAAINGSNFISQPDSSKGVMHDSILSSYQGLAENKINETVKPADGMENRFAFHYYDFVDHNNGNAVTAADKPVTISMPYPSGTDKTTTFKLVRLDGLNREYGINGQPDAKTSIQNSQVIAMSDGLEKGEEQLTFTTSDFGLFALIWEVKKSSGGGGGGGTDIPDPETPLGPLPELNKDDHFAYIVGREDGKAHPMDNITRAEVATIFYRLLTDETREAYWGTVSTYSDVEQDAWYMHAVATLTNAGVLNGRGDGKFAPEAPITRAEFAAVAARFFGGEYEGPDLFTDIENSWAREYINRAAELGIIKGLPDGTFNPGRSITRAEAIAMINRTLERHPHADYLLEEMTTFSDNMDTNAWYYADIQEATNSHDYKLTNEKDEQGNRYEEWTDLRSTPDWSMLEQQWEKEYQEK